MHVGHGVRAARPEGARPGNCRSPEPLDLKHTGRPGRVARGALVFPIASTHESGVRALIIDLDGTLVDTVYAHVFSWQLALAEAGMPIDGWRIHRRIGMSGGLFTRAVAREVGRPLTIEQARFLQ